MINTKETIDQIQATWAQGRRKDEGKIGEILRGAGLHAIKLFFFYQKALISIFSKWKSEKSAITAAEGGGKPNGKCPIFFHVFCSFS